jgi:hypothetical protein
MRAMGFFILEEMNQLLMSIHGAQHADFFEGISCRTIGAEKNSGN